MKEVGKKMQIKDWVQTIVSIGALGVAFTSLIISCNIKNITAEEKQNEFVSTMNITKKTVMNVYFSALLYQEFSLVKLSKDRKTTGRYVPMSFIDIGFVAEMIERKDNVMKRTNEIYDLYVLLKTLEDEIVLHNREFNNYSSIKEEKLSVYEKNVLYPNLKFIEDDCKRVLRKLKSIEVNEDIAMISDTVVCLINENQNKYLRDGSYFTANSFPYLLDLTKLIEDYNDIGEKTKK